MKLVALVLVVAGVAQAAPEGKWGKGDTIELTWVVGPDTKNPKDPYGEGFALPLRPVVLEARMGGVTQRVALKAETGNLFSYNQIMCRTGAYTLTKGELAKLTFYEGGASGYFVTRSTPAQLEIHGWWMSDGACEDPKTGQLGACPGEDKVRATLPVPADVKITGGAIVLLEHGKRVPLVCEPTH
jgi:hypothetical protein